MPPTLVSSMPQASLEEARRQPLVSRLRAALERAERGEIRSVIIGTVDTNGAVESECFGEELDLMACGGFVFHQVNSDDGLDDA